ncbi:alanine acetyltransferase [Xanthomonas sp. AmX2]|uniref:alanine acetyltransferase n=1 Tax=Xanthomonas sp. TaxID=29446 RepID=UPI00197DB915|nr:alanine acetyltransferase [Xanthomonas sp.]MBN6150335.1 alanine acetyltransferase [Xanthomonas sp.]
MAAPDALWSAEQHGWLQAMGYTLYVPGGADAEAAAPEHEAEPIAAVPAPRTAGAAPAAAVERRSASPVATPQRNAPPAPPREPPPRETAAAPVRRAGLRLPDRLQIALLRASGCNPSDPATQTLMATWPLAELRGNPAAKRALWPQLRTLRKKAPR